MYRVEYIDKNNYTCYTQPTKKEQDVIKKARELCNKYGDVFIQVQRNSEWKNYMYLNKEMLHGN
jgi:hypothetical protein